MSTSPLLLAPTISQVEFQYIQRRMSLDFFKWDSQVGDTATLFPQPLLIGSETWNYLKQTAQDLAAELREAENELVRRPELLTRLGLPNTLQAEFERQSYVPANTPTVRVLRFDFHYTTKGWRTSEVNSDVPGGYTEASRFTEMMAQRLQNVRAAGDPGRELAAAVLATVGEKASVALLSAPGFLEDQQVTAFLATELQLRTIRTLLVHDPSQLRWKDGVAFTAGNGKEIELDAIVRFYQGEWLAKLSDRCGWKSLFFGTRTLVANPAIAVLSESKRFPLIWPTLATKMSMWKLVMPECRDPLEGDWNACDEWVVKAAYSNTGDEVHVRDLSDARTWSGVRKAVEKDPRHWVMQRRFETVPINSDIGLLYPCIGVYTINGRACGIYGTASLQPITNYAAHDVAVLITEH